MAIIKLSEPKAKEGGGNTFVDPTKLNVGDKIEGTFLGIKKRKVQHEGRSFFAADLMLRINGKEMPVSGRGQLQYFEKDYVETKKVSVGDYVILECWRADAKKPGFNVAVDTEKADASTKAATGTDDI